MLRNLLGLALVGALTTLLPSSQASAQEERSEARPAIDHYNLEKGRLALEGYDPVAYFEVGGGKPAKGDKDITATHRGVTYRFAKEQNRQAFLNSPERFEPAYGGWCAYAMADGDKVEVNPKQFLIEDGRLYLFYTDLFTDTRKRWNKAGADELAPKADSNWEGISGERRARLNHQNLDQGLAFGGYDPVAYHTSGAARGKAGISATHAGITYQFATEANRATFLESPASYAAGYGGWCAWAMSQGKQVAVDPTAFVVDDGEVRLFYNASKRDDWVERQKDLEPKADRAWAKILGS
jgi:YHS domain-containing protein